MKTPVKTVAPRALILSALLFAAGTLVAPAVILLIAIILTWRRAILRRRFVLVQRNLNA